MPPDVAICRVSGCWFTGSIGNRALVKEQYTLENIKRVPDPLCNGRTGLLGVPQPRAPMTAREYSWLLKQGASQEEEQRTVSPTVGRKAKDPHCPCVLGSPAQGPDLDSIKFY